MDHCIESVFGVAADGSALLRLIHADCELPYLGCCRNRWSVRALGHCIGWRGYTSGASVAPSGPVSDTVTKIYTYQCINLDQCGVL